MAKSTFYASAYRAKKAAKSAGAAKVGDTVYIKDWFRDKIDLPSHAIGVTHNTTVKIIGETEKAFKVSIDTETKDGEYDLHYNRFVPKSVVETKAQRIASDKAADARYEQGKKNYNKMIEFAKQHGVKGVRSGLRKETILKKIKEAGYTYK
jgi:hypothetical protein